MAAINTRKPGDCGYKAFYNNQTIEVYAPSQMAARTLAVKHWGVRSKKAHMVSTVICERADGSTVSHSTAAFG